MQSKTRSVSGVFFSEHRHRIFFSEDKNRGLCAAHGKKIKRTFRRVCHIAHDMGIDHGGLDVFVAEQVLHFPDDYPVHEQVRGKAVPQGVNACVLLNTGLTHRLLYGKHAPRFR
jgi:hypothetical protein